MTKIEIYYQGDLLERKLDMREIYPMRNLVRKRCTTVREILIEGDPYQEITNAKETTKCNLDPTMIKTYCEGDCIMRRPMRNPIMEPHRSAIQEICY